MPDSDTDDHEAAEHASSSPSTEEHGAAVADADGPSAPKAVTREHERPSDDAADAEPSDAERRAIERRLGLPATGAATEQVLAAQDAYDVGDYRRVREIAESLMTNSDAMVARAGLALKTKVDVDPVQVVFLAVSLAAFLFAVYEFF